MAGAAAVKAAVTGFATCEVRVPDRLESRDRLPRRPLRTLAHPLRAGGYFKRAVTALRGVAAIAPERITVEVVEHATRDEFRAWWLEHRKTLGPRAEGHTSSPAVWLNDTDVSPTLAPLG